MTAPDLSEAPQAISNLATWLHAERFILARVARESADRFNQDVLFRRDRLLVHVNATRGDWSLGIGVSTMSETFDPDTWAAWWKGSAVIERTLSLDEQVEFITHTWIAVAERAQQDLDAEEQLIRLGDDWVERHYGFRPRRRR